MPNVVSLIARVVDDVRRMSFAMSRRCKALLVALMVFLSGTASVRADADDEAAIEIMVSAAGEVLALGDLCNWDFATAIEKLHQEAAKALKLTPAQQADLRNRVTAVRRNTFGRFSPEGQARMRADICKPDERARLNRMLEQISFD